MQTAGFISEYLLLDFSYKKNIYKSLDYSDIHLYNTYAILWVWIATVTHTAR